MTNKPVKQHYIPQFILRNFCYADNKTNFFSKKDLEFQERNVKSLFYERNIYTCSNDLQDDPAAIENEMSYLEREIAELFVAKFYGANRIVLTKEEYQILRIFLCLMLFRSKNIKEQMLHKYETENKKRFQEFQPDGDLGAFWKRNLLGLAKCRSFDDIDKSEMIDPPMKLMFTFIIAPTFISVVERRGDYDFILPDSYSMFSFVTTDAGASIMARSTHPISPSRMIVTSDALYCLVNRDLMYKAYQQFYREQWQGDEVTLRVSKVYEDFVLNYDNAGMQESKIGFSAKDLTRVPAMKLFE